MENNNSQRFLMWFFTSVIFGLLPWLVNFLILVISDNISYSLVFRVNDLMFFVIALNATSTLNILLQKNQVGNTALTMIFMAQVLPLLVAAIFLGISSFYTVVPQTSNLFMPVYIRLINGSLVLCGLSLTINLSIQLYFYRLPPTEL